MKAAPFDYYRPASLDEALVLLGELGDEAKVLAGGQSLVPLMAMRLARPTALVDVNRLAELDGIEAGDPGDDAAGPHRTDAAGGLQIGAMVRQRRAEHSPHVRDRAPLVAEALTFVGHPQIRNRGTVGGSLAHADPAAELPTVMTALDAEVVLRRAGATRTVSVHDFFTGYFTTVTQPDEILTQVRIPPPTGRTGSCYQEFSRRHGDFALIGVAATVRVDADDGSVVEVRLALSGAAPRPVRARRAEALAGGQPPGPDLWRAAGAEAAGEIDPAADLQGSADYRRLLAAHLVASSLEEAHRRIASHP
jgi:aerobic carbon-monoxide dehydrogenase medium subunit